jgi:hypothetical protein
LGDDGIFHGECLKITSMLTPNNHAVCRVCMPEIFDLADGQAVFINHTEMS